MIFIKGGVGLVKRAINQRIIIAITNCCRNCSGQVLFSNYTDVCYQGALHIANLPTLGTTDALQPVSQKL